MKKKLICLCGFLILLLLIGCPHASTTEIAPPAGTENPDNPNLPSTPDIGTQGEILVSKLGTWFESAWAEWSAYSGAESYAVYYKEKSAADSSYLKADDMLIRSSVQTNRIDLPGLKADTAHSIKIIPVVSGSELSEKATVINVTPQKFDRSGFAFSKNKTASGAYNDDGTLKEGAHVLYITDTNKDSVKMNVTKGATTTEYTGILAILAAHQSAKTSTPVAIRFIGKVTRPSSVGTGSSNMVDIKYMSNVTIEGIGSDAEIYNWGFVFRELNNAELRNLAFSEFEEDAVSIDTNNFNIWIHHNDFLVGKNMGGDKNKGDGSCDVKKSSDVTIAYNHFHESGKSSLVGLSEGTSFEFNVTMHHNFFEGSGSRHPRTRFANVHVYNNYFKNITTYGSAAARGSSLFIQNNVYENVVRPMIIASQGHDLKNLGPSNSAQGTDSSSILSSEAGGNIKQTGNQFDAFSQSWFNDETYTEAAKRDAGNAVSKLEEGRTAYSNFDTSFTVNGYRYQLDNASAAKERVSTFSGRMKETTGNWQPPELSGEQKVAQVKTALQNALTGRYFTTKTETEAAVRQVIANLEQSFPQGVAVTFETNETEQTTTLTIISGNATDTLVLRKQTDADKIVQAQTLLNEKLETVEYTPNKTAEQVKTQVNAVIENIKAGFATGVTAATAIDAEQNIIITISCASASDTITVNKPSDADYVEYVKTLLQAGIQWNTNAETTLAAAQTSIANATLSQYGVTATAAIKGSGITVTITKGSATDSFTRAAVLFSENFDNGATTFTGTGTWTFVDASGREKVYNGTSSGVFGISAGDIGWTDYTLSADINITSGGGSKKFYVLGRAADEKNGYAFEVNVNSTTAWKINGGILENGLFTNKGDSQATTTLANNQWYTVKMVFSGTSVTMYVNGEQKDTFTDTTRAAGKIAFYSNRNTVQIDNITVTPNN